MLFLTLYIIYMERGEMHPSRKKHDAVLVLAVVIVMMSIFLVLNVPFIPIAVEYSVPEEYLELENYERLTNYSSSLWSSGIRTEREVTWTSPFTPNVVLWNYYSWTFSLTNIDIKGGVFNVTLKVAAVDYKEFSIYIDSGANKQFKEELGPYGPYPENLGVPRPPQQMPQLSASVTAPKIIDQRPVYKTRLVNKTQIVYKSPLQTLLGT